MPTISVVVEKFWELLPEDKVCCRLPLAWKLFLALVPTKERVVRVEATEDATADELAAEDDMPPTKNEFLYILLNYILALLYL